MNSNTISRIEQWYLGQCNGDWEHEFGLKIENIDNPGWKVSIPLERTNCEHKNFSKIDIERSEADWVRCSIQEKHFIAWGGAQNLAEIFEIFLSWIDK